MALSKTSEADFAGCLFGCEDGRSFLDVEIRLCVFLNGFSFRVALPQICFDRSFGDDSDTCL